MLAPNPPVQRRKIWTAHVGGVPFHPAPWAGLKGQVAKEQEFRDASGVGEISTGWLPLLTAPEEMGKVRLANPRNLNGWRREGLVGIVGNRLQPALSCLNIQAIDKSLLESRTARGPGL
jgi:hypothetical protein